MGKISREEVMKIAELARLELSEEEVLRFQSEMARILEYMEILGEVEVREVSPTFYTLGKKTPLRNDVPEREFSRDDMLKNAPDARDGYYVVPRVIE